METSSLTGLHQLCGFHCLQRPSKKLPVYKGGGSASGLETSGVQIGNQCFLRSHWNFRESGRVYSSLIVKDNIKPFSCGIRATLIRSRNFLPVHGYVLDIAGEYAFRAKSLPIGASRKKRLICSPATPGNGSFTNASDSPSDEEGNVKDAKSPSSRSSLRPRWNTMLKQVEKLLETIKWDSKGLVVAIAQHVDTGAILMQGFANREAVAATIASNHATFFSRSRSSLWTKGESSGNFINVVNVYLDCDRDSIIYLGTPDGPTCHTGAETCYYTSAADFESSNSQALTTLYSLEGAIAQRKAEVSAKPSWTKKLVGNPALLCSKIREEADELCRTVEDNEGRERTISEMADLLYHSMVLLAVQDVKVKEVLEVLRGRFSKSGIEEKNSRSTNS